MKISGVVLGVDTQSGISKKTNRPYTKFTIQWSNGVGYDTFDAAISGLATKLQGQPVEAFVRTTQNGGFTNNDILAIAPEGELPEEPENTQSTFTPQNNFQSNGSGGGGNRDTEIRRAVALKGAVDLAAAGKIQVGQIEDVFGQLDRLLLVGPKQLADIPNDVPDDESTTPEEIASTVPNTSVGNW